MNNRDEILNFINVLVGDINKPAGKLLGEIFTNGNCGRFAVALSRAFPGGSLVKPENYNHVLYKYNGFLYDVLGKYENFYNYDDEGNLYIEELHSLSEEEALEIGKDNYGIEKEFMDELL